MYYTNMHRFVLQSFISHSIFEENELEKLIKFAAEKYEGDEISSHVSAVVQNINEKIQSLFMKVKRGRNEMNGVTYYALVNSVEDESAKLTSSYQPHQIDYIKKVIAALITSTDCMVSSIDLVNEGQDLPKRLNTQAAQDVIDQMTADGWLVDSDGEITFGTRSIIELGEYLKSKYPDNVSDCKLCKDFVLLGDLCLYCNEKLHKYCAATYFQNIDPTKRKCPSCNEFWEKELINLPRRASVLPITNGHAKNVASTSSSSNNTTSSGRRSRRSR